MLLAALAKAEFRLWMKGRLLPRLTSYTLVEPARFAALIDDVRSRDHCFAAQEHELGVQALAVPLRDMRGRTVAALNVVEAPPRRDPDSLTKVLLPQLQEAARELRPLL